MKIADAVELATRTTQDILEDMVRTQKVAHFGTMITCYRGADPVAMLVTPPNREKLLQAAILAARGFAPDLLALTHDTFIAPPRGEARLSLDPRTGRAWGENPPDGPGPMQTYVDTFGFDGTVKWLDWEKRSDMKVVGLVPGSLKASMEKVSMDLLLPDWARALIATDPERGRCEMDLATVTAIETKSTVPVTVVLFARPGTPRAQALRKKLSRSQVKDPGKWN